MNVKVITVREDILGANAEKARRNRGILAKHGVLAINIMSSPGSGKTSLILQTIKGLKSETRIAVVEGDIASKIDADRVNREGIPAVQINLPGGCHLDAGMVERGLKNLPLKELDLILIENVGNLVCPAGFELGEQKKVMLLSTPEGDDKPHKYPMMFSEVDALLVNKIDLLPYVNFNMSAFNEAVARLNPSVNIFPVSCQTGEGIGAWLSWLKTEIKRVKSS